MLVRNLQPPRGPWVSAGIALHAQIERLLRRRDLSRLGLSADYHLETEVHLYDEQIGLHGICDAVLTTDDGHVFPLEIKAGASCTAGKNDAVQLCAYALLLEKMRHCSIDRGFVLYEQLGHYKEVVFDRALRNSVRSIATNIKQDCDCCLLPVSDATDRQCSQCEFLNFCADRL